MIGKDVELYDMSTRIKELEFIQSVISRLSDRQQATKYLCIAILGGIFAITSTMDKSIFSVFISLFCSLFIVGNMYLLDRNFFKSEKLYRMWYEFICWKRSETCQWLFELNPKNIKQILKEESVVWDNFNPNLILGKGWSLHLYGAITILLILFYLPTLLAAFSIH